MMKMFDSVSIRDMRRGALSLAIAASLAACGGGSSGGNVRPVDPPPATPTPPVVFDPDPAFSKHEQVTGADQAHAAGFTGEGVRIGIVDSGVMSDHPALSPRVVSNLVYINGTDNNLNVDDVVGHGTAVAQAAAGTAFGAWPGGIAPGAEIVSARIISDETPDDDGSGQGNQVDGPLGLEPIHQDLIDRGVRIMNNSWGGLYWDDPGATDAIADEYRDFIFSNDGLVVFATGNSGFADPSNMAALPSQPGPNGTRPAADLEQGWIAVTAVDPDNPGQLDTVTNDETGETIVYPNACGIAMDYCMAAPGTVVVTGTDDAPDDPSYWTWSGTSLAAPLVSGAAALVWEAFPYFDNDLVRQTLLGTATDIGDPGVDEVFGHGLLNVAAAVKGPGRLDWGNVTANFNGGTSTWSNDITGDGGIIKRGTGTLRLTGRNQYQGTTQVRGGTLRSSFTVSGAATVASEGNLELVRGVAGNLDNNGTVTTLSTRTHQVGGDYTQSASARFAFEVGAPLQVTGTATLEGGEAHVLGVADGYTTSDREDILIAQSGLSGEFDELTWAEGVFLEATLNYDPNTAWLDINRLDVSATAMSLAGATPASVSSAERVESAFRRLDGEGDDAGSGAIVDGDFRALAGEFQRTPSASAAVRSLESLSGELHTADAALAMMAIEGGRHALESRLDAIGDQPFAGGAWGDALRGSRAASRLDIDARGWVMGQDRRMGAFTVGAAFSELDGTAASALGDRERNRQVEAQLYAQWQHDDLYLLGRYSSGRMERRMERRILLGQQGFGVDSDYATRYDTFGLQAGYRFDAAGSTVTPYLGLQSLRMRRDGFSEPGAVGFGLSADGSTLRVDQALVGLRFGRGWHAGATRFDLHARAEWQRTLSQSGADIDARFTGIDVWSPIAGRGFDRDVGVFGLGLDSEVPGWGRFSLSLDTRHEFGETYNAAWLGWSKAF